MKISTFNRQHWSQTGTSSEKHGQREIHGILLLSKNIYFFNMTMQNPNVVVDRVWLPDCKETKIFNVPLTCDQKERFFLKTLCGMYEAFLEKSQICHPRNCQQEHASYTDRLPILSSCRNDWDNLRFINSVPVNKAKVAKNVTLMRTGNIRAMLKYMYLFQPQMGILPEKKFH